MNRRRPTFAPVVSGFRERTVIRPGSKSLSESEMMLTEADEFDGFTESAGKL